MIIGTIGTNFITEIILENMQAVEGMRCAAIYSRSEKRGQALAKKFGVGRVYTSLEKLYSDPELDWIYIASPNSLHAEQARAALLCGKNVLCEKPMTGKAGQTRELAALAREKGLFLWEAILPLFHPHYALVREKLPELGPMKLVSASFCQYSSRYEAFLQGDVPNVFNPAFSGGALMDLNLYNVYFVVGLFGRPLRLQYFPTLHENGIDTNGILIMQYGDFLAQCTGAKDAPGENAVQLMGEKGYIRVTPSASQCQQVKVALRGQEEQFFSTSRNPWLDELLGLAALVKARDYDECYRRLDVAADVAQVLEEARKSGGLGF